MHRGGSHSIETRGVVARYDAAEDHLTVWDSTQTPHSARQLLCEILGRHEGQVRVITPEIGGGFGPKLVFYPEEAAVCLAAMLLQRPVKWIEDRREHFVATTQERDQYWDAEIAYDEDGAHSRPARHADPRSRRLYRARREHPLRLHGGAAARLSGAGLFASSAKLALTNTVPSTPVRGAGQPQGVFVMERLLDRDRRRSRASTAPRCAGAIWCRPRRCHTQRRW